MIAARPLADTLAAVPFFSGLDAASIDRVGRGMRTRRFRRGEVIFHLGDPGDALFIVTSGAIKIMLPSDTGDEAILATLRAGDVFGELALLDGAPRSATAVALEPSETLILPRAPTPSAAQVSGFRQMPRAAAAGTRTGGRATIRAMSSEPVIP